MDERSLTGYPSIDKPWLKYYSEEVIESPLPECTAYEYLYRNNKSHLNEIGLNYYNCRFSYKQLFDGIEQAAKAFSAIGVRKNDVVVVCAVNIPETVYTIYGLNRLGAIVNVIDPRTNESQLCEYVNECKAETVVTIDLAYPTIKKVIRKSSAKNVVIISIADSLPGYKRFLYRAKSNALYLDSGALLWKNFIARGIDETPAYPNYEKGHCFIIAHTGGTTGIPKGVMLSDDCLNAVAHSYQHIPIPIERGHKFFNDLPPFIIYGLSFALHTTLCCGLEVILYPVFDSKNFPKMYAKYKPNHFCALSDHLRYLQCDKATAHLDMSFAITVGVGGDSLDTKLEESVNTFLKRHGCKFNVEKGFGMTELGATAISTFPAANAIGSIGTPLVCNTIKIVDLDTGKELSYNHVGEIWISGPSIMLGYYNNSEATAQILVTDDNGTRWIRTGDLGRINEDGLVFHEGRIRRIYLTAVEGQPAKIFPMLVETAIKKSESVYDCAVVGRFMKNSSYYESVAYVVLRKNLFKPLEDIKRELTLLCSNEVPSYMCPVKYYVVNELPYTPIGKVDFIALENAAKNSET